MQRGGGWRSTFKRSPAKATMPGPKQVFRRYAGGEMHSDVIGTASERLEGESLLVPVVREGRPVRSDTLDEMRARVAAGLASLPQHLRDPAGGQDPYPVSLSERLRELTERALAGQDVGALDG
jgi:nicotinate phosphoribosyltransferase